MMLVENTENELITMEELCSRLMISETTAYKLMRSGEIDAFKLGSHWKIPVTALRDFILSRRWKRAAK